MYESEIWDDNPPSLSGGNNTHPLQWFIDRIGKTVYNVSTSLHVKIHDEEWAIRLCWYQQTSNFYYR